MESTPIQSNTIALTLDSPIDFAFSSRLIAKYISLGKSIKAIVWKISKIVFFSFNSGLC